MTPDEVRRLKAAEYRAFCEYMNEFNAHRE
jgi:hypothetical protein